MRTGILAERNLKTGPSQVPSKRIGRPVRPHEVRPLGLIATLKWATASGFRVFLDIPAVTCDRFQLRYPFRSCLTDRQPDSGRVRQHTLDSWRQVGELRPPELGPPTLRQHPLRGGKLHRGLALIDFPPQKGFVSGQHSREAPFGGHWDRLSRRYDALTRVSRFVDIRKLFTVPGFPRRLLSALAGWAGRMPLPRFLRRSVWGFVAKRLGVERADIPGDLRDYRSFLALFCRPLPEGARPLPSGDSWLSPADGRIVTVSRVTSEGTWLIKGTPYTSRELVPGADVRLLAGYQAIQIYLAPHNYHRFHAPCDLQILEAVTIPGDLQPVDPSLVRRSMRVLVTNKRILLHCKSADGTPLSLLFVGALNVGGMKFVHDDTLGVPPFFEGRRVYEPPISMERGDELGRFEFGSTVVLFAPGQRALLGEEGGPCRAREPLLAGTLSEQN